MVDMVPGDASVSFSRAWWDAVSTATGAFEQPAAFAACVGADDLASLNAGAAEAVRSRLSCDEGERDLRVYLGGEMQTDDYVERLRAMPPLEGEDLVAYCRRTFQGPHCLILNNGERYSELLARTALRMILPLLDVVDGLGRGNDITLFVGDYGWTPLGIHKDRLGESVFQFHLGPGPKIYYTWDEDRYLALAAGRQNNTDIAPLLPHARRTAVRAGDLFFMPWNFYHVGHCDQLSITVSVWLNKATRARYVETLLEIFRRQYVGEDRVLSGPELEAVRLATHRDALPMPLGIESGVLGASLREVLATLAIEHHRLVSSNGGWLVSPLPPPGVPVHAGRLRHMAVRRVPLFEILHRRVGSKLQVHVRGQKIELKYFAEIEALIDRLNKQAVVEVEELLASAGSMPAESVLHFLSLLIRKRGVEPVEPARSASVDVRERKAT